MKPVKQVLIVRKDLNMRKGKIGAQCAHASMGALLKLASREGDILTLKMPVAMKEWLEGRFTKVTLYVNSEEELDALAAKVKADSILHCLITDSGLTEFNGVPTKTVLAIGPEYSEIIDKYTGDLPLF